MWEAATEYFQWVDDNPWIKIEQLKRPTVSYDETGKPTVHAIAELPTARPYTLKGFCLYLDCGHNYWDQFKKAKAIDDDFSVIISRIEDIIYTQKFEGAAVGAFNPSIIARDLGLADKTEVKRTGTHAVRRDEESGDIIIEEVHD